MSCTVGKDKRETRLIIFCQGERGRADGGLYSSYDTCRQNGNVSLLLLTVSRQTKMSVRSEDQS